MTQAYLLLIMVNVKLPLQPKNRRANFKPNRTTFTDEPRWRSVSYDLVSFSKYLRF